MIPHVLHIKNFLSYGPETQIIDFKPFSLISLSGKNGHGKSALLDAITWAIWGQARKSSGQSKPDAGLMHLGQKHMMVILEFEVNGTTYRVRREYLQTQSKPFATLDFGIQHPDGKLIALTDKTIKDTQDKIERTIGITYESFTNSTFLRQGQSNEFSKKSPKERKDILAQILQLQQFEHQKKIALAHARKQQIEYQTQLQVQQRIQQELVDAATVTMQYVQIQEQLAAQKLAIVTQQTALQYNQNEQQKIKNLQNEASFLQKQHQELSTEHHAILQTIQQHQDALTQNKNILPKATLLDQEQQLVAKLQLYQKNQQEKLQLKELYLTTKEQLNLLTQKFNVEFDQKRQDLMMSQTKEEELLKHIRKQIHQEQTNLMQLSDQINVAQQETNKYQEQLSKQELIKSTYEQHKNLLDMSRQQYQQICAQGTYVKQYIQKIQSDEQHVASPDHQDCLQCQQPLNAHQKSMIILKLQQEQTDLQQQLTQLKNDALQSKNNINEHQAAVAQYQEKYEQCLQINARYQQHQQTYQKLIDQQIVQQQQVATIQKEEQASLLQIQKLHAQLTELQQENEQKIQNSDVTTYTQKLKDIEQQAHALTYNPQDHQTTEQNLQSVRQQLELYSNQNQDVQRQTIIEQLLKQAHDTQLKIIEITQQLNNYLHIAQQLLELKQQETTIVNHTKTLEQQYQQDLVYKGSLEQKQKKQQELEVELQAISARSKVVHQEMVDYQEIAKALGKDGIQALLIEQAIPEIEHETNLILSRLTNNQTQIFIESLRDLKKGGSKETLDIKIADPFGLRDYEMFSGGEAFRIDFALRIGISKLLARRAGTALQTIFIDEGFGSQDDEGLNLIMDNIYKIQEDFAKIIVVSHLQEMKEHFPVQFIVEKKRSGSTISIIHQG